MSHFVPVKTKNLPLLLLALFLLGGCAQYATVSQRKIRFINSPTVTGTLADVDKKLALAVRNETRDSRKALGEYIAAADSGSQILLRNPSDAPAFSQAQNSYNFAVSRVFGVISKSGLEPWTAPLVIPSENGDYTLTFQLDRRPQWHPSLYKFTPADEFDIRGTYVTKRQTKTGIGAPIVAESKGIRENARTSFVSDKTFYCVTAVLNFQGRRATLVCEDPLNKETTTLNGKRFPLAADYTVPLAVMLAREDPKKLEIARVFKPGKFAETARIVRLQPFDPAKTVVLVIHGLADTQATWTPLINELRADATVRSHYQFWFYSYPSGYPYPHSAAILRRELDSIEKKFALKRKIVVIGHSMGGCISRLLLTDTGNQVWLKTFGKTPEKTRLSPKTRKLFTEALIFRHRPEIGRVIFIASPLKGSDMAVNWLGRFASSLVRLPLTLLEAGNEAFKIMTFQEGGLSLKRIPNSIDTLAPNNGFVRIINTIPIVSGIPYHVIPGDRGRGDAPNSSDGIVPYWSSHMEGAKSELVVPSGHSAHQNPQAIEEVRRILKLHVRS